MTVEISKQSKTLNFLMTTCKQNLKTFKESQAALPSNPKLKYSPRKKMNLFSLSVMCSQTLR